MDRIREQFVIWCACPQDIERFVFWLIPEKLKKANASSKDVSHFAGILGINFEEPSELIRPTCDSTIYRKLLVKCYELLELIKKKPQMMARQGRSFNCRSGRVDKIGFVATSVSRNSHVPAELDPN